MRDLLIVCPTRERRAGAERLLNAVRDTCTADTDLVFAVDDDDPSYDGLLATIVRGPRQDTGPWTNEVACRYAVLYRAVASVCDDHLPHTIGWDARLLAALGDRPGVAYGNDLFQQEKWPTAAVVSAPIIGILGYMAPPGVDHLYIDCFWKRLGEDLGWLHYLPDVIIEHLHPVAGKAEWDDSYNRSNSADQYSRDGVAYEAFLRDRWPADLKRLREEL